MISAPSAACTDSGMPRRRAASSSDSSGFASAGCSLERATEALAHAQAVPHAGDERLVHLAPRLVGHAEGAVPQAGGDVLRGRAEAGDLVVVDGGRAVHRDVRDDAAPHQLDEHGCEAGLHDVAAEHDDDAALRVAPRRRRRSRRRGSRARRGRRAARAGRRGRSGRRRAAARSRARSPCSSRTATGTVRTAARSASPRGVRRCGDYLALVRAGLDGTISGTG